MNTNTDPSMAVDEPASEMLRAMRRIRAVEERIAEVYSEQEIRCPTHLSVGQEMPPVAVCSSLTPADQVVSTHRSHAHYLAKGGDLNAMIAELYGKATGCSKGKGGSMHLVDRRAGFMGCTPIVGSSIPIGAGLALSLQLRGSDAIACVFHGDGSVEEGVFYETANFAAVRSLPLLFVCENNLYSVYSPLHVRQPAGRSIAGLASAIGVPSVAFTGTDAGELREIAAEQIAAVRAGSGPRFLEIATYRWREHCGPNYDNDLPYRDESEFLAWQARDPLAILEHKLRSDGVLAQVQLDKMDAGIADEIDRAFAAARAAPFPPPESMCSGLFRDADVGIPWRDN